MMEQSIDMVIRAAVGQSTAMFLCILTLDCHLVQLAFCSEHDCEHYLLITHRLTQSLLNLFSSLV